MTTNIPEMLPIREVAARTGMSYEAIRHLCVTGEIVHIRVGSRSGKYLVNFARFIDYLNGEKQGGKSQL